MHDSGNIRRRSRPLPQTEITARHQRDVALEAAINSTFHQLDLEPHQSLVMIWGREAAECTSNSTTLSSGGSIGYMLGNEIKHVRTRGDFGETLLSLLEDPWPNVR